MFAKRFKGQVAAVVGGARGIGLAVARRLAREGAAVFCLDILEEALAESLNIATVQVDVRDGSQVESVLARLLDEQGRIDVLVNCAGIVGETGVPVVESDPETFLKVLDVNLVGAYYLTKHVLPAMLRNDYGRILHVASIGGKEGNPGMVGYAASKAGLMGLVKAVGKEYAHTGITVNGLAPAVIATPMNADTTKEMLNYMKAKIPMSRLGTVEEAAAIISWIVSPEASFNTGFIFDLSGGRATF